MNCELIITEHAYEMLDAAICHILIEFSSKKAAEHLLTAFRETCEGIKTFPEMYPISKDSVLCQKKYREANLLEMKYKIIYKVEGNKAYILGISHDLENYRIKY